MQKNKNLLELTLTLTSRLNLHSQDIVPLSDLAEYSTEKIKVGSLDLSSYYSTENILPNKEGSTISSGLPALNQVTKVMPGDTLLSNIRPYFKKIVFADRTGGCSNDVLCLHPKLPEYRYLVFLATYPDSFFDYVMTGAKGTKMPRGDKSQILDFKIRKPDSEALCKFNAIVSRIFDEITCRSKENESLSMVRNELLPRLISGEIEII
ncbi:restriction endonuclease subunit S [Faecalibaculum rodentium]|uniref:restriction endonuclease subunit S n=1 Tax=Faecalibaculum rodentium TaxID=1702221 RepID=UPI0023F336D9|nr:restriction endonuclease subunit S [Faecalibaculum rodentium]